MAGLVLTDASPLIGLSRVNGLPWLESLFGTVWMPPQVHEEVVTSYGFEGEASIVAAISAGWLKVSSAPPTQPDLPDLDEGETACIRLALASQTKALLLMDERAGRAVAQEHGLRVAGTAAVIGMAKKSGLIVCAKDVFARLHASDFRISAHVISSVLRRVGE